MSRYGLKGVAAEGSCPHAAEIGVPAREYTRMPVWSRSGSKIRRLWNASTFVLKLYLLPLGSVSGPVAGLPS